ncbi:MAG: hypothetical protein RI885_1633 [Actinomycetota bacterium]
MTPSDDPTVSSAVVIAGRPRWRVGLGAAVVVVLAATAIAVLVSMLGAPGSSQVVPAASAEAGPAASDPLAPQQATAVVHVLGAVVRPGVFELRAGDRLLDAVAAAGGFSESADRSRLNLARPIVDGEQVLVPAVGEVIALPPATSPGAGDSGGRVNLNSADEAALDTLPGVGPATAKSIIDWRTQNGRFASVEDLLGVPGIGDKTLDTLRDLVTV